MNRVLVVDDHALIRRGLRQVLTSAPSPYEVGEVANGGDALTAIRAGGWNVVLLDLQLPDRDGIELLKLIKAEFPSLPVLVISFHDEEQYAARVLRSGAAGYLAKDGPPEEILLALSRVLAGGRYMTPALAERLANDFVAGRASAPHAQLSDREFQVLQRLAIGKTVSEIAAELMLSVKTISTYRAGILRKMDLRNNAEIVQYGLRNGLAR